MPLVVVALLAVGGAVGATQGWFDATNPSTANSPASASATDQMSAPESPSTSPSETPSESASPSAAAEAAGESELKGCRDKVEAADDVLAAAEVGLGHWSEHVQAQTDANAGKISMDKMDAIFKRTRLAGPDDVSAYSDAKKDYGDESGSCDPVTGASAKIADSLSACNKRAEAQQPVLDAAADGMADWKSHLAAMQRSRMGHVHDAQGVWIKAWKAAPPHIEAYQKAVKKFDAPDC
ncbi:MAG: hypothetical protein ABWX96_19660 [Propionibacteriaceae bacterium]